MIRLLLDPPRFECDEPGEAAVLAGLMGIKAVSAPPVIVREPIASVPPKPSPAPAPKPVSRFASRGPMTPTGSSKTCKKCGASFPVLDRTDCPSVYCRACRPVQVPRKNPKAPIPAAGKLGVRKHADPVVCRGRDCGASVPEFESIDGLCLQCAPMAARKRAS